MELVLAALLGVFASLIAGELSDWSPRLSRLLLSMAVARLPAQLRERYEEEWQADLDSTPGRIVQLFRGFGFLYASLELRLIETRNKPSEAPKAGTDNPAEDTIPTTQSEKLRALTEHFHAIYSQLLTDTESPPISLTPRERECLQWCAHGKSSWEIGVILGISEHGASFHLKNAMYKLQTTSRVGAVVKAIRLGFIGL